MCIWFPFHQTGNFQSQVSCLCPFFNLKKCLAQHMSLWLTTECDCHQSDHRLRLEAAGQARPLGRGVEEHGEGSAHWPACSKATSMDCSMRSLSMKLRKSSLYTVRSGSWKAQMGISRGCSLLPPPPPLEETWDRARETRLELAWEMPLDRRFSAMRNGSHLRTYKTHSKNFPLMWWWLPLDKVSTQGKTVSLTGYQISRPSFSCQI